MLYKTIVLGLLEQNLQEPDAADDAEPATEPPDVAEMAERIKTLKAGNTVEAALAAHLVDRHDAILQIGLLLRHRQVLVHRSGSWLACKDCTVADLSTSFGQPCADLDESGTTQ